VHFTLAEAAETEIPGLFAGRVPNPASSDLGSGNWSTFPKCFIFGGGYTDERIDKLRKLVAQEPGAKKIPWLRVDASKPHPPLGPDGAYGRAILERTTAKLAEMKGEGKLDDNEGDDGIYWL
jgi:hypothetical protein